MIKVDIINEVAKAADITKVRAEVAVEAVLEAMKDSLMKGERIELRRPHFHQCELRGHEEAVQGDEEQAQGEAEPGGHGARRRFPGAGALRQDEGEDRHSGGSIGMGGQRTQ